MFWRGTVPPQNPEGGVPELEEWNPSVSNHPDYRVKPSDPRWDELCVQEDGWESRVFILTGISQSYGMLHVCVSVCFCAQQITSALFQLYEFTAST